MTSNQVKNGLQRGDSALRSASSVEKRTFTSAARLRALVFPQPASPLQRAKERLELTRRYCQAASIRRMVVHAELLPRELSVNLDSIEPQSTENAQAVLRASPTYIQLIELLSVQGYREAPSDLICSLAAKLQLPANSLWTMFDLALWHQDIDHDLTQPLKPWAPLIRGGRAIKDALLLDWMGPAR